MGNKNSGLQNKDPDSAWKKQNEAAKHNPIYKFVGIDKTGSLISIYKEHGREKVIETIKREIEPKYLYNNGQGAVITKKKYFEWYKKVEGDSESSGKLSKSNISTISNNDLDNFKLDKYSTFPQHEACWILDKRGGVGETPFHLCYLMGTPVHSEVGQIFLELYPKMSLDIYEGSEYYGESALHIAIVYGDLEAVKMLVKAGADVNQRASGQFFVPEDVKAGKSITETNYEGYAYYGEFPLAFAACFSHQEIYDFLIAHGADPNYQDSFGNTVLHMLVIADQPKMYKYAVQHLVKKADNHIQNYANLTPLTLASKLGRHRIFQEMLEINSFDMWKYSNITCSMYPLKALDSIGPDGKANWNSALMIIADGTTDEHLDMLQGGVIRQLLDEKWKTFARKRFLLRLLLAFIHLALLSVAVYTRPARQSLLVISGPKDIVRVTAEILTCLMCIFALAIELKEICAHFSSFLRNSKHAPDQTIYLMSCVLLLLCIPFRFASLPDVEDTLLTIAVPCAFFYLLFFARVIRTTGPFVTMIYEMCTHDLVKFGLVYLIFLLGFTQGFFFLFRDVDVDSAEVLKFSTPWETVLNLFQMTLGEFKYETFNYARYIALTKFLFTIFMILVPILLLNMLIAMMGNTYTNVNTKSEKEWRRQWAKIVVVLERGFTKKQLLKYQEEYSVSLSSGDSSERALVVIKAANKSCAKQSKAAKSNWKRLTKLILVELKRHKKKGSKKPFHVKKFRKKYEKEYNRENLASAIVENQSSLTSAVEQIAWVKDVSFRKNSKAEPEENIASNRTTPDKPSRKPLIDNRIYPADEDEISPPRQIKPFEESESSIGVPMPGSIQMESPNKTSMSYHNATDNTRSNLNQQKKIKQSKKVALDTSRTMLVNIEDEEDDDEDETSHV